MDLETFQHLPADEVARLVRAAGPQVCVFPINGTRRWYLLEHPGEAGMSMEDYMGASARSYIRLLSMLYTHGIDTILSPAFGDDLLTRGPEYATAALVHGLPMLGMADFMAFYRQFDLRVRFYGNYASALNQPVHAPVRSALENITNQTRRNGTGRLFFGLFANDATQTLGKLAIDFYLRENRYPERTQLVSLYYGEYIEPASLFIGFEKPAVFDYPLLGLGNESLYFSAAPTPYLTERGLRAILYDHLFRRPIKDPDWERLSETDSQALRSYYHQEQETILGTGDIFHGTWIQHAAGNLRKNL